MLGAGLAGCAALVVAGCGSSGSSAGPATAGASVSVSRAASGGSKEPGSAALVNSMQTSVRKASSVHVTGRLSRGGIPLTVDLKVNRNGDMAGTISQNGAPAQILAVKDTIYVKATGAFLKEMKAPADACAAVCGKWIKLTAQQAGQLTGDLSMKNLMTPLTTGQVPKLTETGSTTVNGEQAFVLRAADGSTLDVSAASQHYPLQAATGGNPRQTVTYTQWNAVPAPVPPPASQVLNASGV